MTCNLSNPVPGPAGSSRRGCSWHTSPVSRWLGVLLAIALFGVDAFQPVTGLVEVPRKTAKDKPARKAPTQEPAGGRIILVTIQAWPWQQPCGELWPAFVFQPTINAGAAGSNSFSSSTGTQAAVPCSSLVWALPLLAVRGPAVPVDRAVVLRFPWCHQVRPMAPPIA